MFQMAVLSGPTFAKEVAEGGLHGGLVGGGDGRRARAGNHEMDAAVLRWSGVLGHHLLGESGNVDGTLRADFEPGAGNVFIQGTPNDRDSYTFRPGFGTDTIVEAGGDFDKVVFETLAARVSGSG